ncbi:hypothetical protein A7985_06420 [Pseudoalteromonas luteoviolacea]|uniref:DUF1289 domain-containing protein n=1 Tax=Pseudoalteromonas luteoviolacea TaxID=43657 RepID=A0A1C0TW68_9GAMM|nr:DUF1289 domain-containing protein [Pseudoalteromonas luteoviolacea]MBQ4810096.1 DUF1289 domain-containing protein [Pseudoalteromonas luteoviolacea]OCQ23572.1 hypothetical protein A7985_06420 [Pseudoalteromonas luteoviolacea]
MGQKSTEKQVNVASPCIRNCCLDDKDICVGCLRHIDEIVGWGSKSPQEKLDILAKCESRKQTKQK